MLYLKMYITQRTVLKSLTSLCLLHSLILQFTYSSNVAVLLQCLRSSANVIVCIFSTSWRLREPPCEIPTLRSWCSWRRTTITSRQWSRSRRTSHNDWISYANRKNRERAIILKVSIILTIVTMILLCYRYTLFESCFLSYNILKFKMVKS